MAATTTEEGGKSSGSSDKLHLVVGATGPSGLGWEICVRLAKKGLRVRALVRPTSDPKRVEVLFQLGVELVKGDLKDPASLVAACAGVSTILTSATTTLSQQPGDSIESVDLKGYQNLIEAAKASGTVEHFVYTSYSKNIDIPCALTNAKRTIESLVTESGVFRSYTVLRPSYFVEVWLGPALGFDIKNAKARIYGTGDGKVSWIATGDVAEFAVASLENPAAHNAILELGGPEPLSQHEVVRMCEELMNGRQFELEYMSEISLQQQLEASENNPLQQSFTALMLSCAYGDAIVMTDTLNSFAPLKLTTVREYLDRQING